MKKLLLIAFFLHLSNFVFADSIDFRVINQVKGCISLGPSSSFSLTTNPYEYIHESLYCADALGHSNIVYLKLNPEQKYLFNLGDFRYPTHPKIDTTCYNREIMMNKRQISLHISNINNVIYCLDANANAIFNEIIFPNRSSFSLDS